MCLYLVSCASDEEGQKRDTQYSRANNKVADVVTDPNRGDFTKGNKAPVVVQNSPQDLCEKQSDEWMFDMASSSCLKLDGSLSGVDICAQLAVESKYNAGSNSCEFTAETITLTNKEKCEQVNGTWGSNLCYDPSTEDKAKKGKCKDGKSLIGKKCYSLVDFSGVKDPEGEAKPPISLDSICDEDKNLACFQGAEKDVFLQASETLVVEQICALEGLFYDAKLNICQSVVEANKLSESSMVDEAIQTDFDQVDMNDTNRAESSAK